MNRTYSCAFYDFPHTGQRLLSELWRPNKFIQRPAASYYQPGWIQVTSLDFFKCCFWFPLYLRNTVIRFELVEISCCFNLSRREQRQAGKKALPFFVSAMSLRYAFIDRLSLMFLFFCSSVSSFARLFVCAPFLLCSVSYMCVCLYSYFLSCHRLLCSFVHF